MPKRYAKRRTPLYPRKRVKKTQAKISSPVRSYVNRAIRRNEETKLSTVQYTLANFNSKINTAADLITLLPQIGVGVNQNNRIGNAIRPVRMEITGYVIYAAQAITAKLFCSHK